MEGTVDSGALPGSTPAPPTFAPTSVLCYAFCKNVRGNIVVLADDEEIADHRAHQLLESHLTEEEQYKLLYSRKLFVRGGSTGTEYAISYAGRVSFQSNLLLAGWSTVASWSLCSVPSVVMPLADRVLALLLMIRSKDGEQHFLDNAFPLGGTPNLPTAGVHEIVLRQMRSDRRSHFVWADPSRRWIRLQDDSVIYDRNGVVKEFRFNLTKMCIEAVPPKKLTLFRRLGRVLRTSRD